MKTRFPSYELLAAIGLAALLAAILACTSFSPDDSKVAYPVFDVKAEGFGIAVYDRKAGTSQLLFVPPKTASSKDSQFITPQWLPDGSNIVVGWATKDDNLSFALVPFGSPGPTNSFAFKFSDAAQVLLTPLAIADSRLFLLASTNEILRVDLSSGVITTNLLPADQPLLRLYPSRSGDSLHYLAQSPTKKDHLVVGRLNPDTFARTPLGEFPCGHFKDIGFAFSPDAKKVLLLEAEEDDSLLRIAPLGEGSKELPRVLKKAEAGLLFGNAVFSSKGDVIYASFQRSLAQSNKVACGVAEIPLDGGSIRYTTLLREVGKNGDNPIGFFPVELSHDGKTLALCSIYLASNDNLPAEDCALFLVDLSNAARKVTKVPIPFPDTPKK